MDFYLHPFYKWPLKSTPNAYALWTYLKDHFWSNKDSKTIHILCSLSMGDSSVADYFTKVQKLADLLENLDSKVIEKNLVIYTLNCLAQKFEQIALTIRHTTPLPLFDITWSTVEFEEQRIKLLDQAIINTTPPLLPLFLMLITQVTLPVVEETIVKGWFSSHGGRRGRNGGGCGRYENNSSSIGFYGQNQHLPRGWGFGWYPLTRLDTQHQHMGLLHTPSQHRPTSSRPI